MTGGAVTLVEGDVIDLEAMVAVMEDSFDPRFGEAWTASQCAGLLPMRDVWLTLAQQGEQYVGFALARHIGPEAELLLLAVSRAAQGRGIGSMLLDRFERDAKTRGADRLHLEVRDGNRAVNLYMGSGFTLVGRRKNYYQGADGHCYDALTLAKGAHDRA